MINKKSEARKLEWRLGIRKGGWKHTEEWKRKKSESMKGKKPKNLESIQKMSWTIERKKRMSEAQSGKNNINWGKPLSEECKKKISKALSGRIRSKEHCRKISEARKGEKSHFWQGGKSFESYTLDWTKTLRRSIRERDNYICQLCGKTQIEELENIGWRLSIHHKDYDKKNCNPTNLITLCDSCNIKVNFNREYWIKYFQIL